MFKKPLQHYWQYELGEILIFDTNINILEEFPITVSEPWIRNVNGTAIYFDKQKTIIHTEREHLLQLLEQPMTHEELVEKMSQFVLDAEYRISSIAKKSVRIDPDSRLTFKATGNINSFNFNRN